MLWFLGIALVAGIGVGLWWYNLLPGIPDFELKPENAVSVHSIVVQEVSNLGKVELVKISFQDVITHEVPVEYLPDPKVMLRVYGETVACVDFAKIGEDNIDIQGDTVMLDLPAPEICYSRIDHKKSEIVETWFTALYAEGQRLIDQAFEIAEDKMAQAALSSDIYGKAEEQAQRSLVPLLEQLTEKKVFLRFPPREDPPIQPVERPLPRRLDLTPSVMNAQDTSIPPSSIRP